MTVTGGARRASCPLAVDDRFSCAKLIQEKVGHGLIRATLALDPQKCAAVFSIATIAKGVCEKIMLKQKDRVG